MLDNLVDVRVGAESDNAYACVDCPARDKEDGGNGTCWDAEGCIAKTGLPND